MTLYGRMVAAGDWDMGLDIGQAMRIRDMEQIHYIGDFTWIAF